VRILLSCAFVLAAGMAHAQSNPPAVPGSGAPEEKPTLRERLSKPDQAGGLHFTDHFAVALGGIKQGSGIALGPAFSTTFPNGGFVQLKAVYSIKRFWVLQARYDTPRFWSDRAILISRLRWYDAPELSLYRLGADSPNARSEYSERRTDGTTLLMFKPVPKIRLNAGFGVERYATGAEPLPVEEGAQALRETPALPGLGTHPWFAHSYASIAHDTRLSLDYSRRGHNAEIGLHDYHDWKSGQDSFRRLETSLQQLIPTHDERGVIDVGLRTWFTDGKDQGSVPFFLMPTLGGGDLLRAFPSYRFRDRNAMLFKAEYRWAVHKMLDVAGLYEAGEVAPRVKDLDFEDMAHSYGIGIRAHSDKASLFRADLAHGREGWGFRVGFTAGGS
jgi:hypothetical protein